MKLYSVAIFSQRSIEVAAGDGNHHRTRSYTKVLLGLMEHVRAQWKPIDETHRHTEPRYRRPGCACRLTRIDIRARQM